MQRLWKHVIAGVAVAVTLATATTAGAQTPRMPARRRGAWTSASVSTTASAATSTRAASASSTARPLSSSRTRTRTSTARACNPVRRRLHDRRDDRVPRHLHLPVARRRPHAAGRHRRLEALRAVRTTTRVSVSTSVFRQYMDLTADDPRLRRGTHRHRVRRRDRRPPRRRRRQSRRQATDFYDRTAAFTLAATSACSSQSREKVGVFAQIGLRYVTGHVGSRRPGRHRPRDDQRQERALDDAVRRRRPAPLLERIDEHGQAPYQSKRAPIRTMRGPVIAVGRETRRRNWS